MPQITQSFLWVVQSIKPSVLTEWKALCWGLWLLECVRTLVLLKGEEQEGGDSQGEGDGPWDGRRRRKGTGHLSGPFLLACNT